nr:PREDICTED: putative odorant-binding protein A5 isoform X1 [Bemisia tabaci]
MQIQGLYRFIATVQLTIFTTIELVTNSLPLTTIPLHTHKQSKGKQEISMKKLSNTTPANLPVFTPPTIDPGIKPFLNKILDDSDLNVDSDEEAKLREQEKKLENCDPEVQDILREMEEESNDIYYPTEVNYFNQNIDHFLNKTAKELKCLQERNQIYSDLIEMPAENIIQVAYGTVEVAMGNEIHARYTTRMPTFVTWPAKKDSQYCLIMTDPDTSYHSRPTEPREYQHWIVVNIPGNNLTGGETITEYVRPNPEYDDDGFHRFIFFVFKQEEKDKIYDEVKRSHIPVKSLRKDFSTKLFAKRHHLKGPVAINFFIAKWDRSINEEEELFGPLHH